MHLPIDNCMVKKESYITIFSELDERFKIIEYLLNNRIGNLSIGTIKVIAEHTGLTASRVNSFLKLLEEKDIIQRYRTGVFKLSNKLLSLDALKESNLSNSSLLSNPHVMVYRCNYDQEWTMQFVSNGCLSLTEYPPECFIQNSVVSFNQIIAPEYKDYIWREWDRVIVMGLPFHFEYEIITATGQRKWVLELGHANFDVQNRLQALEGIIIDITNRKDAKNQISWHN